MKENIDFEAMLRDNDIHRPVNCSKCGRFLKYVGCGEYKCADCGFTEYDDYGKIRGYLEVYPGASIVQVEKDTGVDQKTINRLIKQGKLVAKHGTIMGGNNE